MNKTLKGIFCLGIFSSLMYPLDHGVPGRGTMAWMQKAAFGGAGLGEGLPTPNHRMTCRYAPHGQPYNGDNDTHLTHTVWPVPGYMQTPSVGTQRMLLSPQIEFQCLFFCSFNFW